jgi:hypothetical protein
MLNILKNKQNTFNDMSLKSKNNPLKSNNSIYSLSIENNKIKSKSDKEEYNNLIYYPSSSKEWFSSVYSYNKSYTKPLIVLDFVSNKLFSSYFNMYTDKIKRLFKRRRHNKSRYSANKVYVSRAELKHTNSKLLIILSTYNKQKSSLLKETRKIIYFKRMYKILGELKDKYVVKHKTYFKLLKSIIDKSRIVIVEKLLKNGKTKVERYIPAQIKRLNHKLNFIFKRKFLLSRKWDMLFLKKNNNNTLINFLSNFKNKNTYKVPSYSSWLLTNNVKVVKMLFNNTRLISFNKSKFNNLVLNLRNLGLTSLLEKIYGKKVVIKLVDLKSIHLNSDVFSSAVALKLRDRKNKAVRVLRKAVLQMVKIPDLHTLITFDDNIQPMDKNNVVNTIKQQIVSGVRFEAAGRLTRRLTAMRSVFKYRYLGSLKNLRSSLNNKSSVLLRGHAKANSQYTLINSKTRNGTFGLKGWVSSH